jgi:hypothetical protein
MSAVRFRASGNPPVKSPPEVLFAVMLIDGLPMVTTVVYVTAGLRELEAGPP